MTDYSNIFSLITRMRQMACHPDLVIRSKTNAGMFGEQDGEATVCRLCNDIAEDAIQAKCRHIFDRECIKQYLDASIEVHVSLSFSIIIFFSFFNRRSGARGVACLPSLSPCPHNRSGSPGFGVGNASHRTSGHPWPFGHRHMAIEFQDRSSSRRIEQSA